MPWALIIVSLQVPSWNCEAGGFRAIHLIASSNELHNLNSGEPDASRMPLKVKSDWSTRVSN